MQTLFKGNLDSTATLSLIKIKFEHFFLAGQKKTVNNLPYLGFRGGVLARLKGERRQALQGNISFVILTDLNLVATINNNNQ